MPSDIFVSLSETTRILFFTVTIDTVNYQRLQNCIIIMWFYSNLWYNCHYNLVCGHRSLIPVHWDDKKRFSDLGWGLHRK
jgi:hypothetical protein